MSDHAAQHAAPVPAILRYLRAIDGLVRRVEVVALVTVLVTMITLAFAQVLMRKLRPIFPDHVQEVPWFDILNRHLVLWVAILGASIAAREGRHFGVEILPKLFSEGGRRRLESMLNLAAGLVAALITVAMWKYVVLSQTQVLFVIDAIQVANERDPGTHALGVDRRWLISIMPLGLGLMTARFFLRSLEALLLSDEQWHHFERELKPDLVAAADPAKEPASQGSGAVVEAATPPDVQRLQEATESGRTEGPAQATGSPPIVAPSAPTASPASSGASSSGASSSGASSVPAPIPSRTQRAHTSTDEIKVRRLGDLDDVTDPEPRAGGPPPPDAEEALVDSDMVMAEPMVDEQSAAPTERAPRPEAPEAGEEKKS